jgi:hypothetical protein
MGYLIRLVYVTASDVLTHAQDGIRLDHIEDKARRKEHDYGGAKFKHADLLGFGDMYCGIKGVSKRSRPMPIIGDIRVMCKSDATDICSPDLD